MDLFLTNTHLLASLDVNWWTGVVWIIVMFLSDVWTLILTAPIHCRASIAEQVMKCYISTNQMKKQTHLWLHHYFVYYRYLLVSHEKCLLNLSNISRNFFRFWKWTTSIFTSKVANLTWNITETFVNKALFYPMYSR